MLLPIFVTVINVLVFANTNTQNSTSSAANTTIPESEADKFLKWYDEKSSELCRESVVTSWDYSTNITDESQNKSVEASLVYGKFLKDTWKNISQYDWKNFKDPSLKRQFKMLAVIGTSALSDEKLTKFEKIVSKMEGIYSSTKICAYRNAEKCDLSLDPEITEIMSDSRDFDELLHVWHQWHISVGRPIKLLYKDYVQLGNEGAQLNGLKNFGEIWRHPYDTPSLQTDVAHLWEQLKPFYQQLHAYVRKKLVEKYGPEKVNRTGPIPAHILGNMWAQEWTNIIDFVQPFPNTTKVDISEKLKKEYTVRKMFDAAEDFFGSLKLFKVPESFWKSSMLEKPSDGREVVCHASAWDFCDRHDVRVKMCTKKNQEDFITIHHEMGHIQYYMQYKDQPITFREGANPGFHEAVGDTLALSVATPKHLHRVGLLQNDTQTEEDDLNFLFRMALSKIAFLPFGYVVDLWRWKVFAGEIPEDDWNQQWWTMRREFQGIYPYIQRSSTDFDPAAKYHVSGNSAYLSYFVSAIIQLQFHKALCIEANEYIEGVKPLHKCDIFQSEKAGKKLAHALRLGSSVPWEEVMQVLTGQRKMDAKPLLEYFSPLHKFLEEENKKTNEKIGWD